MRTRKMIMAVLVACACSLTASAQKKEKDTKEKDKTEVSAPSHRDGMNLTDEQKKKMKEIHLKTAKEVMTLKNQAGEKKAHLRTLTTADKPDMNEINKTIDEMSALQAQIMKKKTAARMEVRAMLTDEQRVMFDTRQGKGKKMKRGPHHGPGKHGMNHGDRD